MHMASSHTLLLALDGEICLLLSFHDLGFARGRELRKGYIAAALWKAQMTLPRPLYLSRHQHPGALTFPLFPIYNGANPSFIFYFFSCLDFCLWLLFSWWVFWLIGVLGYLWILWWYVLKRRSLFLFFLGLVWSLVFVLGIQFIEGMDWPECLFGCFVLKCSVIKAAYQSEPWNTQII